MQDLTRLSKSQWDVYKSKYSIIYGDISDANQHNKSSRTDALV